jgi:hypothetical protein
MAALDREERAADVYAGLVRRTGRLASSPADLVASRGTTTRELGPL